MTLHVKTELVTVLVKTMYSGTRFHGPGLCVAELSAIGIIRLLCRMNEKRSVKKKKKNLVKCVQIIVKMAISQNTSARISGQGNKRRNHHLILKEKNERNKYQCLEMICKTAFWAVFWCWQQTCPFHQPLQRQAHPSKQTLLSSVPGEGREGRTVTRTAGEKGVAMVLLFLFHDRKTVMVWVEWCEPSSLALWRSEWVDLWLIYLGSPKPAREHCETLSPSSVFRVCRWELGIGMNTAPEILWGDSSSCLEMDPGAPGPDQFDRNWLSSAKKDLH